MPWSGRSAIRVAVVAVLGWIAVGCSEGKVAQCNRLIEVANRAVGEVRAVTQNTSPQDVDAMSKIANTADQTAAEMQAIELTDEQLQTYKDRFISMYADTSKATRDLVAAMGDRNGQAAEQAYTALQTATNQEATLVTEVNTYCSGGN